MQATYGRSVIPVTVVKRGLIGRQNTSANGRKGCYVMAFREKLRVVPNAPGRPLVAGEVSASTSGNNVFIRRGVQGLPILRTLDEIESSVTSVNTYIEIPFVYDDAFASGGKADVEDRLRTVRAGDRVTFMLYDGVELVYTSPVLGVVSAIKTSSFEAWGMYVRASDSARALQNGNQQTLGLGFGLLEGSTQVVPLGTGQTFTPFDVWAEVEGDLVTPGNLVIGLSGEIGELPVRIVKFRCRADSRLNDARRINWDGVSWFVDSLRQVSGREFNIDLRRVI